MQKKLICILLGIFACSLSACTVKNQTLVYNEKEKIMTEQYYFPSEKNQHEGTWLIWPHHYTYGIEYRNEIEYIWLEMTKALCSSEFVHIIAYNETEQERIIKLLEKEEIDMSQIDFVIAKTDDVWVRDTGPIFVFDHFNQLTIANFSFNGWGNKTPFKKDSKIPEIVAKDKEIPLISIPKFVLEGGSIELDGSGTAMLCKSSVISKNRNELLSITDAEEYISPYFGVKNFIWLEGVIDEDLTDAHIDGIARFYDDTTLLTVSENDFFELYEEIKAEDYETLVTAKNANDLSYQIIELPLTAKNVEGVDYKGSYLNYYVGNEVVLLPIYNDTNDEEAINILTELYSNRKIIPINVVPLYQYGGMIHCITQQQPES